MKEKQRNRKRGIEPIDQLWLFLTRVRLGLFESEACLGFVILKAITGENSTSRLLSFPHYLGFDVQHLLSGVISLTVTFSSCPQVSI